MSLVVKICWTGFTVGTEIGVVADGTLVAVSYDVSRLGDTERTIAVDADVVDLIHGGSNRSSRIIEMLVNGDEPMTGVDEICVYYAS